MLPNKAFTEAAKRLYAMGRSRLAGHVAGYRFGAGAHVHFLVDMFEMASHGLCADGELAGDFLVGLTFG